MCKFSSLQMQNVTGVVVPVLKHHAMKMYGIMDIQIHVFLTSTLDGGEW
jgi:hypothetical protein